MNQCRASAQSSLRQVESGSAVVEFVLVMVPSLLLMNLLIAVVFASLLRTANLSLASELAQACGLADFHPQSLESQSPESQSLASVAKRFKPNWLQLESATCQRDSNLASVEVVSSLPEPFTSISSRIIWHAAAEISQ
jgi:hypothetical protein